jgi:hypothetical protein
VALDVSSTAAGIAIVTVSGSLVRCELVRPPASWESLRRIEAIVTGVHDQLSGSQASLAVLEWTGGKVAGRLQGCAPSGLAVLGQAQGAVWEMIRHRLPGGCVCVSENEWTQAKSKSRRAATVRLLCPEYAAWADTHGDAGLDVADAIGLGLWAGAKIREAALLDRLTAGDPRGRMPGW